MAPGRCTQEAGSHYMNLTYPGKHGDGQKYRATLRALCGPDIESKTMIDLMCCEATGTRDLPFREKTFVDIVPRESMRDLQNYVIEHVLSEHPAVSGVNRYDVAICSDGIEHLTKWNGHRLLTRMTLLADRNIIFTPLGDYLVGDGTGPDDHKSGWLPSDFPKEWGTLILPDYHEKLGIGAFFAWHCTDIEDDFARVRPILERIWNPTLADRVQDCIAAAERRESNASPEAMGVPAFSGAKVKHLLNNLCAIPLLGCRYLEVGVHKGGTFCPALSGNNATGATAIDNWSEFNEDGRTKAEFERNRIRFAPGSHLIDADCFDVSHRHITQPVDIFFYDGNHSEESQYRALRHFLPAMADPFVLVVDDYSWRDTPGAKIGTQRAIDDLGLNVLFERELVPERESDSDGWWNGLGVFVLGKP